MKTSVVIAACFAALLTLGSCRSHKEVVKSDSVSVHQVHDSHTLQQFRDSAASFDSLRIDMQNVKILVLPSDSNMVVHGGPSAAQDSGRSSGVLPGIIACMEKMATGSGIVGKGLILSADNISISKGKECVEVKETVYAKRDSSARDSSRYVKKDKVTDKPQSGWTPLFFILGIFALAVIVELIRKKYKRK